MSMKLSYRDKIIVIVVAVLVVLGIGIFSFIKPRYEDLQVSKERLASKQDEKAQVEAKMNTLEGLKKQLEDNIKAVVEDQKKFLNEEEYGETYQISRYLMEKFADVENFQITEVTMDRLTNTKLEAYYYDKYAVAYPLKINGDINGELPPEVKYTFEGSYPDAPAPVELAGNIVTVGYKCESDEQLLEAIQKIADNDKNLYILTFSGSYAMAAEIEADGDAEEAPYNGELTIAVFEIYPLDPDDIKAD